MPLLNTDTAFVLKPHKTSTNTGYGEVGINHACFFIAMDFLIPQTDPCRENIQKNIRKASHLLVACLRILKALAEINYSDTNQKHRFPQETNKIRDGLSDNLKRNLATLIEDREQYADITPEDCHAFVDIYVDEFLESLDPQQPCCYSRKEWVQQAYSLVITEPCVIMVNIVFRALLLESTLPRPDFSNIHPHDQRCNAIRSAMASFQLHAARQAGFVLETQWTPNQPAAQLLAAVQKHGMMLVCGFFSPGKVTGLIQKKIEGLAVLGYKKGTFDQHAALQSRKGHAVIITGVTLAGFAGQKQDLVYYIDPAEPLNEAGELPTRIISYPLFCQRIGSTSAFFASHGNTLKDPFVMTHPSLAPALELPSPPVSKQVVTPPTLLPRLSLFSLRPSCKTIASVAAIATVGVASVALRMGDGGE